MLALAPQSRDLPASLIPFSFFYPKLFQWPCRELVYRIAGPIPTPNTLVFWPLPTPLWWVPRTNQSSQNSSVKGLLYVPGAAGRGLVAYHCPCPTPKERAQPAMTG